MQQTPSAKYANTSWGTIWGVFLGLLLVSGMSLEMGCAPSESRWNDTTLQHLSESPRDLDNTLQHGSIEHNDLLLLTLAVRHPSKAPVFCKKVQSKSAQEKCQQVIGRPHLQLSKPQPNDVQQNAPSKSGSSNKPSLTTP